MAKFNQPGDGPTPEVLLVEGPDDYHFFGHFRRLHGLDGIFRIEDGKGVPNILGTLTTRLRADNENHIGIVLDADFTNVNGGVTARWNALTYALNEAGYTDIPKRPEAAGTILIQVDRPIVGIWLMPDNVEDGTLENFVSTIRMAGEYLTQVATLLSQSRRFRRKVPLSYAAISNTI